MKAGKLRHRVTLQAPGGAQDPVTGEMTPGWADVATVWAHVEPLSVREFIQSGANQSQLSARITIRYREGVNASMRAIHRGRIYNIHGVQADAESGRDYLTLPVSEGTGDGE